jgi:enoyl-CoA hydratase/carnithine racemase
MLLQAKRYGADEAHRLGVVDQLSEDGGAVAAAVAWLNSVLKHPASSIAGALEILRCAHSSERVRIEVERAVFSRLWAGDAHRVALGIEKADG